MALGQPNQRAVGVFSRYEDAEAALNELRKAGFSMRHLSIIAPDLHRRENITGVDVNHHRTMGDAAAAPAVYTDRDSTAGRSGEGAATGALAGGTVGGLIGLIEGLTALTIPGVGPIVVGGAIATILANTLAGGALGAAAGGLVGALVGLGIPEEKARMYNDRLSRGEYLLLVEGTADEIHRAEAILSRLGIQQWGIYDIPGERMSTGRHQRAVGLFSTQRETEHALHELQAAGFAMDKVSVIARDRHENIGGVEVKDRVGNKADEGAAAGALTGGALGGLTGFLVGLGTLAIPGIGPLVLAGAEATAIASTLAGGAIGAAAGGLVGALIGWGIPEERARMYSDRVAHGDYLIVVKGTEEEIRLADSILRSRGIREWGIYDLPGVYSQQADRARRGQADVNYNPAGRL